MTSGAATFLLCNLNSSRLCTLPVVEGVEALFLAHVDAFGMVEIHYKAVWACAKSSSIGISTNSVFAMLWIATFVNVLAHVRDWAQFVPYWTCTNEGTHDILTLSGWWTSSRNLVSKNKLDHGFTVLGTHFLAFVDIFAVVAIVCDLITTWTLA